MPRLQVVLARTLGCVGRSREAAALRELLSGDHPTALVHLNGIAGVGKSTLLRAFLDEVRAAGGEVVELDCRTIEPTERGFLQELNAALGTDGKDREAVALGLEQLGRPVIVALDNYEVFGLMDTWLRLQFLPVLDEHVGVILAGREPPSAAWAAAPEWQGLFRSLPLGPLGDAESLELLARCGIATQVGHRLNRIARGHPMTLKLAASAVAQRPELDVEDAATHGVIEQLTAAFLEDIDDPVMRRVLDAASVVRRTTQPLLVAMLPEAAPSDVLGRLRALPFVDTARDGLVLHGAVQQAIAARLKSLHPVRHRTYRRAAWRELRREVASVGRSELWRYTADMLYLIENPIVREAFFPSSPHPLTVEPAQPGDADVIRSVCDAEEPAGAAALLHGWAARAPDAFSVARDRDGRVVGCHVVFDPHDVDRVYLRTDPVTRAWSEHLIEHRVRPGERVLFLRRWLGAGEGEGPSPVQAACWLDIKRAYMALRPDLRRVYLVVRDLNAYAATASQLGFSPIGSVDIDGERYHSLLLDFGPGSVDGWLTGLVAEELGLDDAVALDAAAGEAVIDGQRIALTPLEFAVLERLHATPGKVVGRLVLLEDVWGHDYVGGSNVVDSAVRSLRRKLGDHADLIQTVRGFGYRFRTL